MQTGEKVPSVVTPRLPSTLNEFAQGGRSIRGYILLGIAPSNTVCPSFSASTGEKPPRGRGGFTLIFSWHRSLRNACFPRWLQIVMYAYVSSRKFWTFLLLCVSANGESPSPKRKPYSECSDWNMICHTSDCSCSAIVVSNPYDKLSTGCFSHNLFLAHIFLTDGFP